MKNKSFVFNRLRGFRESLGNTKIFLPSDWFGELLLMTVGAPPPTWENALRERRWTQPALAKFLCARDDQ